MAPPSRDDSKRGYGNDSNGYLRRLRPAIRAQRGSSGVGSFTSARIGAASSCTLGFLRLMASACMELTTTPMNRLSTMNVATMMKANR